MSDGLASRRMAARLLDDVLKRGSALEERWQALRREGAPLTLADAAFARALATASLRHLGHLRAALATRMTLGMPDRAGRLEALLTLGAAQLLFLDTPDHAAVDTTVALIREDRHAGRYASLANAVLRRIGREREQILASPSPDAPGWLLARWIARFGAETTAAIMEAHRREPALDLTVRGDAAAWAARLAGRNVFGQSVRAPGHAAVPELDGFEEGLWWVQDAAASLPALLVDARPGERILDLCAAPGGKTAQLASTGASVVAVDRAPQRMERLARNLARLRLEAETYIGDAFGYAPAERFDAVLLDAPCSATGTIRRHPDVAWTKSAADIGTLATLQSRLLTHAAGLLKPGGRLVYATCSLEPEEGEDQAAGFLAAHPDFRIDPAGPFLPAEIRSAAAREGWLRTLPCMLPDADPRLAGLDGFFAVRLVQDA